MGRSVAQDFTVDAFSVPMRGEHFPFAPDGWVDLIGDSMPVIPEDVFADDILPMATEWLAEIW